MSDEKDLPNACVAPICATCGHSREDHEDPGYVPKCTFGAHGYTCDCNSFAPALSSGPTEEEKRHEMTRNALHRARDMGIQTCVSIAAMYAEHDMTAKQVHEALLKAQREWPADAHTKGPAK